MKYIVLQKFWLRDISLEPGQIITDPVSPRWLRLRLIGVYKDPSDTENSVNENANIDNDIAEKIVKANCDCGCLLSDLKDSTEDVDNADNTENTETSNTEVNVTVNNESANIKTKFSERRANRKFKRRKELELIDKETSEKIVNNIN